MTHPGDPGYAAAARRAAAAPEEPAGAVRRRPAPQTLRRRLLVVIAALVVLVSAIVGLVSVAVLHNQLLDRLDAQLHSATDRAARTLGDEPGEDDEEHEDRVPLPPEGAEALLRIPGQPVGAIAALVTDRAVVTFGAIDEEGDFVSPPQQVAPVLASVPTDRRPVTVELEGLGEYRAIAAPTDGGFSFVVAFPLDDVNSTTVQLALTIGVVAIAGLGAALALGAVIVRRALLPLDRVTETATLVSELPLARGDVELPHEVPVDDERTEVGRLASSFNRMLGHVSASLTAREQSERKVRRFVADASHELRTPLASIRGYAELTRLHGGELPPDVVHALGRIESESLRMTELVEDLLLLARLDEGRELRRDAVDLTQLVVDAVGDAQVAAPDHEWEVDVPDDRITVSGDASRLHQVIANLLANARVHTPEGTRIEVRLSREGGRGAQRMVRMTVTDDGPGIDEGVRATMFERFARGDASRSRRAGSTGLGLAIVRAVVEAHHGTVDVDSEPGRTRFTVELPAA